MASTSQHISICTVLPMTSLKLILVDEYQRSHRNGLYDQNNFIRGRLLPSFSTLISSPVVSPSPDAVDSDIAPQYNGIQVPVDDVRRRNYRKRKCRSHGCEKFALHGGHCISHGGGRRCKHGNCTTAAQSGGFCKAHGGGSRCNVVGCDRVARKAGWCVKHVGRKLCSSYGCKKSAHFQGLCVGHGGGRRCEKPNCTKSVQSGGLCFAHGGGKRCLKPNCRKAPRRDEYCTSHTKVS